MKSQIVWLILVWLIVPFNLAAKEPPANGMSQQVSLKRDRALAAARSATHRSGTSFEVLRDLRVTTNTQETARRARREARLHHVSLYGDGIFLNVLNTGGFLILESDPTTGNALSIYLVSIGDDGAPAIESHEVEGNLPVPLASELVKNTADFLDALLAMPTSTRVETIEGRFLGGRFPEYEDPGEQSIFAIPHSVRRIGADEVQYARLAALFGSYIFWPVRYAATMSTYAANPSGALATAREKHEALTAQFLRKNKQRPDFVYDLQDMESLRSPEQLRDRISWFAQLDDFLGEVLKSEGGTPAFEVNKSISTIAMQLGSVTNGKQDSFLAVTSPGIIVEWSRLATGALAVKKVSLAEAHE